MPNIQIPEGFIFPEPPEPEEPKWKRYEKVIAHIEESYPGCTIIHDHKVKGRRSGVERQVDVWLEAKVGDNHVVTVAIECRCHEDTPVAIKDVDAFYGFLDDVAANKGVMISNTGFTDGAKARADKADIQLRALTLEEAEEFDWDDYIGDSCEAWACDYGTIHWTYSEGNESEWGRCHNCGSFHIRCRICGWVGCYDESRIVKCTGCDMRFRILQDHGMTVGIEEIPPEREDEPQEDEGEEPQRAAGG